MVVRARDRNEQRLVGTTNVVVDSAALRLGVTALRVARSLRFGDQCQKQCTLHSVAGLQLQLPGEQSQLHNITEQFQRAKVATRVRAFAPVSRTIRFEVDHEPLTE